VNAFAAVLSAAHVPMTTNELTANTAEDSMSMAATDLYKPPIPVEDPKAAQTFLPYRTSWKTIMKVRRTLSEREIEMNGRVDQGLTFTHPGVGRIARIPIATTQGLALSVTSARGEPEYIPTEPRYMRKGKAMTQRFME